MNTLAPPRKTTPDPVIRHAAPADEAAIVELLRTSLGEGAIPRSAEYWRWKHEKNPFGVSSLLVAEDDGRLVGVRAFMRWKWLWGGHSCLPDDSTSDSERQKCLPHYVAAVRAVDTATHPEWRGRGIFRRLTLQLRDDVESQGTAFIFNTPNSQSRPGYLKMGWSAVGRPSLWVRAVRPFHLAQILCRDGLAGEEGETPLVNAAQAGDVLCEKGVDEIVRAATPVQIDKLHTPHTLAYLRWRYADVPGFTYYGLRRGDGPDGAVIFLRSRRRGKLREIRICDGLLGPTREARKNAVRLVRTVPKIAEVDLVLATPAGRAALRWALAASGCVPVPRLGPTLTVYPFPAAAGLPDPRRLASWAASIGDLELF